MGYCMEQRDSCFLVKNENVDKMLDAIKALSSKADKYGFAWVDMNFVAAENISEAMRCWRWSIDFDTNGNIDSIFFEGEKSGDDLIIFSAIAPYVEDGSYIEMQGEDDFRWRWVFKNGQCKEVAAKITVEWEE